MPAPWPACSGSAWSPARSGERDQPVGGRAVPDAADASSPRRPAEQSAYDKWLDQTSTREEARSDRIHGAVGVIPTPLWIVLFFSAALIFVFMLFFADSGERAVVQAMLMGTSVAVITAMLLLLQSLDNPFHDGIGGLRPVAMERTLEIIDQELTIAGQDAPPPCDDQREPAVGGWRGLADAPCRRACSSSAGWRRAARRLRRPARGARRRAGRRARPGARRRRPADAGPRRGVRRADRAHAGERGRLPEVGAGHRRRRGRGGVAAGLGGDQPGRAVGHRSTPRSVDYLRADARRPSGAVHAAAHGDASVAARHRHARARGARRGGPYRAGHPGQHRAARLAGRGDQQPAAARRRRLPADPRARTSSPSS